MARLLVRILIVLSIAMALANARCVAQCLVQPCESGGDHCHSHGKSKTGQCAHQHDMTVSGLDSHATSDAGQLVLPFTFVRLDPQMIWREEDGPDPSPPLPSHAALQPLRI